MLAFAKDDPDRVNIKIVGSGTVYPYAKAVSTAYAARYKVPMPEIEIGGSGSGFKKFCAGVGKGFPDITNASRPMKLKEWNQCNKNGVSSITEVKFGSDGIALVTSTKNREIKNLTRLQLYTAIAEFIPLNGVMVRNPYRSWNEIDPSLPNKVIQIYGPERSHGTYFVMSKIIIQDTCVKHIAYFKALENRVDAREYKKQLKKYCSKPRNDGAFIGLSADPAQILHMLNANKSSLFFIGYAVLFANRDTLRAVSIDDVEPRIYTISDKSYILNRPLYFYIKNAHRTLIPRLNNYIKEFMSKNAMDTFGYLVRLGLGGLPVEELKDAQYAVAIGSKMRRFQDIGKIKRHHEH